MVPIKHTVFLLTVYGMKNTVRLIGTLEYALRPTTTSRTHNKHRVAFMQGRWKGGGRRGAHITV